MKKEGKIIKSAEVKKVLNKIGKSLKKFYASSKKVVLAIVTKIKEISKTRYGKIDGNYLLIGGLLALVLVLFFIVNLFKGNVVDYPVVYNNTDGDLYLITKNAKNDEEAIKLGIVNNTSHPSEMLLDFYLMTEEENENEWGK